MQLRLCFGLDVFRLVNSDTLFVVNEFVLELGHVVLDGCLTVWLLPLSNELLDEASQLDRLPEQVRTYFDEQKLVLRSQLTRDHVQYEQRVDDVELVGILTLSLWKFKQDLEVSQHLLYFLWVYQPLHDHLVNLSQTGVVLVQALQYWVLSRIVMLSLFLRALSQLWLWAHSLSTVQVVSNTARLLQKLEWLQQLILCLTEECMRQGRLFY